jgi:hypothetical protein
MNLNQIYALKELAQKYLTKNGYFLFLHEWDNRDLSHGTYESYRRMRNGICYNNFPATLREIRHYPLKTDTVIIGDEDHTEAIDVSKLSSSQGSVIL